MIKVEEAFTWDDTLLPYLEASNEDDLVLQAFHEAVLPELTVHRHCSWIEVGPGPGTKSLRMLEGLVRQSIRVDSTLLEPSPRWRDYLYLHGLVRQLEGISGTTVSVCASPLSSYECQQLNAQTPDLALVTCVHVLYDEVAIAGFQSLLHNLKNNKAVSLYFVVLESEESDFRVLRSLLKDCGFRVPHAQNNNLPQLLSAGGASSRVVGSNVAKTCAITPDAIHHWLLPFLLGLSLDDYRRLPNTKQCLAEALVKDFLRDRDGSVLGIPDTTTVARVGGPEDQ